MTSATSSAHPSITARLLLETVAVALLLAYLALQLPAAPEPRAWLLLPLALLQGCWLHRIYVVGHEAVHHKLIPDRPWLNDLVGQLILLPLLVPLRIYRKIHRFHHGHNRRDHRTSALDTFIVPAGAGPLRRGLCWLVWYLSVFAGGFFVHSLVSVVLFLALPLRLARRVSPAFHGWTIRDQLASLLAFAAGLAFHLLVAYLLGADAWARILGWPLLAFAWVYSLFVYIYHYDTTYGEPVRDNARSLQRVPLLAWWLLNFNEHATHHRDASIPWYRLPDARRAPPPRAEANQRVTTIAAAVLAQLRGPRIIEEPRR